ncbi:sodium-dependent transporter [Bacillus sp. FJAT-50079]|uniref:sodium-dependent transporter n=1 Tax=Bacillus sp. FJAT-50079 TaxID=2833577 RepID=UPI001BC9F49C|nr:sodium-dependent transporter [Bacillus sp. FJAT-50079]MBS4208524.1 sodium-dependent transporter [Bacillus sp. FJAT-50079]
MEKRAQFTSRAGFIFAAVGSAIGLGNIWRFPAVAYENGGGAFFLPYLFALLTAGIPLLILEFTIGHKYRGSSPLSLARISRGAEWIGWWQIGISFVIATYYSVIIAWAMAYTVFSFKLDWGKDTTSFLIEDYLQVGDPASMGSFVPGVFIPLVLVWIIVLGILFAGVRKGIELATKIMIPLLVFLFLIIVIQALTLNGAVEGLNQFFKPDWSSIFNGKVWVAAYGQIFFSLSIGFAIMITYSSYLPKKADITNSAFITGFANSSFELLAGFGVFAALGFMAAQQGVGVDEVVKSGVLLAFAAFPTIINELPAFQQAFGILFFVSLTLAGLTSLISILETYVAGIQEKFNMSRSMAVSIGGGLTALISLFFATQNGLNLLDVADYFINNFGVAMAGLFEVIFIAWFAKQLKPLQAHADAVSDIKLGAWWRISLSVITPAVLGYMMYDNLKQNLMGDYGGGDYSREFLFNYGWTVALAAIFFGVLLTMKPWKQVTLDEKEGL